MSETEFIQSLAIVYVFGAIFAYFESKDSNDMESVFLVNWLFCPLIMPVVCTYRIVHTLQKLSLCSKGKQPGEMFQITD